MPDSVPWYRPSALVRSAIDSAERERRAFYSGKRWRRVRALKLSRDPLCESCRAEGRVVAANTVHHRLERLDRPDLAYSLPKLASSCAACHTRYHNRMRQR